MRDRISAIKISLRILLNRVEALKIPGQVNYELEQKVKEFSDKIYELGDLLEEIDCIIND
jgi:hypothetical protein